MIKTIICIIVTLFLHAIILFHQNFQYVEHGLAMLVEKAIVASFMLTVLYCYEEKRAEIHYLNDKQLDNIISEIQTFNIRQKSQCISLEDYYFVN